MIRSPELCEFKHGERGEVRGLIVYPMGGTADGARGDHVLLAPPYICKPHSTRRPVRIEPAAASTGVIGGLRRLSNFPTFVVEETLVRL